MHSMQTKIMMILGPIESSYFSKNIFMTSLTIFKQLVAYAILKFNFFILMIPENGSE